MTLGFFLVAAQGLSGFGASGFQGFWAFGLRGLSGSRLWGFWGFRLSGSWGFGLLKVFGALGGGGGVRRFFRALGFRVCFGILALGFEWFYEGER